MIKLKFFCCFDENFNKTRKWTLTHIVNIAHPDHLQNAIEGEYATHSPEGWKHEIELEGTLAATLCYPNDCYPLTIHKISKDGKKVFATEDHYSYNAEAPGGYDYTNDYLDKPEFWSEFQLKKNGRWVPKGSNMHSLPVLSIGSKRFYQNPEI